MRHWSTYINIWAGCSQINANEMPPLAVVKQPLKGLGIITPLKLEIYSRVLLCDTYIDRLYLVSLYYILVYRSNNGYTYSKSFYGDFTISSIDHSKMNTYIVIITTTGEKSFSIFRRLKTYLRNTTGQLRLNGMATLNIYSTY